MSAATMTRNEMSKDVGGWKYTRPIRPIMAMYQSPGPCYGLPGLTGQLDHDKRSVHRKGPAFIFGIKHGKFREDCSPGPCYFPSVKIYRDGHDGTPHYSLYSRPVDSVRFYVPGPGAYSLEETGLQGRHCAPKYSFGIRHRSRQSDQTPAPNRYTLDSMLGPTVRSGKIQAPIYSVRGRNTIGSFHEDLQKTPGPKYPIVPCEYTKMRPPMYSMTSRNTMPGDSTTKPGPGSHSPEFVTVNRRSAPCCSFGMRHSQYKTVMMAEPSDLYCAGRIVRKAVETSFTMVYNYTIPRVPIAAMYTSPGPCYALPGLFGHIEQLHDPRSVHTKKPAYTFGLLDRRIAKSLGPGPKYYPHSKLYRDGLDGTPHYTMRPQLIPLAPFRVPGPGTYCPERTFPCSTNPTAPQYTMRTRTRLRSTDKTPAPNAYTLPNVVGPTPAKKQMPIWTMSPSTNKGGFAEDFAKAPGPGTYHSTDPSSYKRRFPQYSMAARVFTPGDRTQIPGPGAHCPEKINVKREAPKFSMGIKHSPYLSPLIVETLEP